MLDGAQLVTYGTHMQPPTTQTVASRISDLMASNGVSTKALADQTGIARMTLARRLTGNSPFTIAELDALAAHFNTTTAALVSEAAA